MSQREPVPDQSGTRAGEACPVCPLEKGVIVSDCEICLGTGVVKRYRAEDFAAPLDLIDDLPTSTRAAEVRTAVGMADRIAEERDRLRRANERLSSALAHVVNRVSTEGRDDEHGLIFHVGKWAIQWAEWEIDGSAAERAASDEQSATS